MLQNLLENLHSCSIGPGRFRGTGISTLMLHWRTPGGTLRFHIEFYLEMFIKLPTQNLDAISKNLITWSSYARMTMLLKGS